MTDDEYIQGLIKLARMSRGNARHQYEHMACMALITKHARSKGRTFTWFPG